MRPPLPIVALLILQAWPAAAQESPAACRRDLLVAESGLRVARDNLDAVGDSDADRCRTWRANVAALRRAAGVFARCLEGRERAERVAQVEGPAREFDGLVRDRCRAR
jgi:hypothetical protein